MLKDYFHRKYYIFRSIAKKTRSCICMCLDNRVHRSRGEFAKVIKSIRYAQENWVSTMLNTNITFILAKNDGNHVAF